MTKNILPTLLYPQNNGYVNDLRPVLQGTGEPGASINGKLDAQTFSAVVSNNGVWSCNLKNDLADLTEHVVAFSQLNVDGQMSPQTTINFKTDTKQLCPHTLKYPAKNQKINTNTPTISGTGKPGATIELNLPSSVYNAVVNPDGNWNIETEALPDGSSFMHIVQKDMGNISPAICAGFVVDTIAPNVPVLDFPYDQSYINNPKPVFCGKGEPSASIDAVVDEKKYSAVVNAQGNWSFEAAEALLDDTHIISARQIDLAGNRSPEAVSVFTVKTVQPDPPVISNPSNGAIISTATPTLCGQGENGCVIITRIFDKIYSALVDNNSSWEMKIADRLDEGNNVLKVYQVDRAGNISSNLDFTIRIDTAAPASPVILYPEKGKYVSSADFVIKGTGEPDATVSCTVASSEYTTKVRNDGSWSIDLTNNNYIKYKINYIITAKQTDLAGNVSNIVKTEFFVDKDALKTPEVSYPKANSSVNTAMPTISGNGKAGAIINLSINNKDYSTKVKNNNSWSVDVIGNLSQGENKITVTQTDCGNISPITTICFNVKLGVPPCPTLISPSNNEVVENQSVTLKGSGKAGMQISIKLDDASYTAVTDQTGSWEYTVSGLLQDIHSVLVSQTDEAGNESLYDQVCFISKAVNTALNYSNGPTSYQLIYNPPGPRWTSKTIATLKTSNPILINNTLGNEFSMVFSANGLYDFNYCEPDGGNGKITAGVTWIDNHPPVLDFVYSGNWFSCEKTVNYYKFGGSCIKNALMNNVPFESGKKVCEEGIYKLEVSDTAGNITAGCFVIDRSTPDVSGVENNQTYKNDVTINFSDNLSGIKSASLNKNSILPGTTVTENGEYKLTVIDNADNKVERSFSIKKANA